MDYHYNIIILNTVTIQIQQRYHNITINIQNYFLIYLAIHIFSNNKKNPQFYYTK